MTPLVHKHLFFDHLAHRLEAMEHAATPLAPVAYRLYARRLRQAIAGYRMAGAAANLAGWRPAIAEALEDRYFDEHGRLPGPQGGWVEVMASKLIERVAAR